MISLRRLFILVAAFVLVVSVSLAQGPKKDIGTKVPIPATPPPMDRESPPQKGDRPPQAESISIDVDLVEIDVAVTDNSGNPLSGLTKSQFKVFDDNVEQTVTNFSPSDAPLTVVILVEFGETFGYFYDDVVQPTAGFINSLRPEDWGALIAYDIRPEILTDFTKNKTELFNGLRRLRNPAYRETVLYDAVWDTLERMETVDGKKAIFLVSTGLDTISKHSYPDTLKKAQASDTMIYPVSMGQSARMYFESRGMSGEDSIGFLQADNVLRSLAEASGGTAFYPKFQGEFRGIFETVSALLRNQYSIGFVPSNRKADGKLHKLRVEVPPIDLNKDGKPDKLKVKHKQGYYAPKS
jgi:Ca-activated chloride channel homolog